MTIKDQFANSLVKGIGRTAGTILVFGLIGTAWYVYGKSIVKNVYEYKSKYLTSHQSFKTKSTNEKETSTTEDDLTNVHQNNDKITMEDISSEQEHDDYEEDENNEDFKYRKIFDNIK